MRSVGLKTPSLQHTVALMRSSVDGTLREFQLLEAARIDFNYFPSKSLYKPLMERTFTLVQALDQIKRTKNPKAIKPNSDLIEAFTTYASGKEVRWFNPYPRDIFPIAPGVGIPINPAGFWAEDGRLKLLWVQTWKGRTLDPLQKAIFNTILDRRVFVGDDWKDAQLEWVDLRSPNARSPRGVEVLGRDSFDILTDEELKRHLDILLEAFERFSEIRATRRTREKADKPPSAAPLLELMDGRKY